MVGSSSGGVSRAGGSRGPRSAEVAEKSRRRAKSGLSRAGPRGAPRAVRGARRRPRRAPEAAGGPPLPKEFLRLFLGDGKDAPDPAKTSPGRSWRASGLVGAARGTERPGPRRQQGPRKLLADVADPPRGARFAQRGGGVAEGGDSRTHLHGSLRRGGRLSVLRGPSSWTLLLHSGSRPTPYSCSRQVPT